MNNSKISLSGIFPPIPTPFDADGNVATQKLIENIERWNQYDLSGYVVLGSNGEAGFLSMEEKLLVWKTARQAIPPDKLLIAGAGCESTRQTIALSRQVADIGADAVLLVTPHYYDGAMKPDNLIHHYQAVADAVPIPVMLYTVPKFTHVDINAATIAHLASHPNIVGIKDTSGNMAKMADTVRLTQAVAPDFQVLAGSAGFLLAGLTLGAVGGILALSNIAPDKCLEIYRMFKAGQMDDVAELQRRMIPVNAAITARFGIAGLKVTLDMLGYYGGPVRSPLLNITEDDQQTLRDILVEGGVL
ncbi:MAG: dihydrodipicolinate synthase family protein [Chloroflexi bacterium]|nr:dihydrodipicolinate synthase family protein [Chloroflexota bacterium]